MKRVIRNHDPRFRVFGGISIDENQEIKFNWTSDNSTDIMSLAEDTSGEFDKDDVRFVYGYEFRNTAPADQKKLVRNYVKGISDSSALFTEDVEEFVDQAVLRLDERYPLSNFQATVHIESTHSPSLVDVMREYLWEYTDNSDLDFRIIKEAYAHVQFDIDKAKAALRAKHYTEAKIQKTIEYTIQKFENLKKSGQLFQMKRFLPREIREGFFDFLKFRSEEEKETYSALQGVNVLIFDDFMTSGSTVNEVIRYLKAIHDRNTLTVFILVKQ